MCHFSYFIGAFLAFVECLKLANQTDDMLFLFSCAQKPSILVCKKIFV